MRTKTEINRGKKLLFESMIAPSSATVNSSTNVNTKPCGAKESFSAHRMSATLGVADAAPTVGRPSTLEDWNAIEQRLVSSYQCRRLAECAYAHYCASLPKFARSGAALLVPLERVKNVRINDESHKHYSDDAEKAGRIVGGSKPKRSPNASPGSEETKSRKGRNSAASSAGGGGKSGKQQQNTDVVASVRLNMCKFFSHCRSHVVRMSTSNNAAVKESGTPVVLPRQQQVGRILPLASSSPTDTSVCDMMFRVTLAEPLLNGFQNQSLIPFVLTVECVKNMPDIPTDFATLHDCCTPAYIQYQLFADNEDPTPAATAEAVHRSAPVLRQMRNMIVDDTFVVLVGLKDKEKVKECLLGSPLEIAIHDRDMLGRQPLTNSFGVAHFDLSVLLNSMQSADHNEIFRISAPVHANIPGYNDWTKLVGKPSDIPAPGAKPPPGVFEEGNEMDGGASNGAVLTAGGGGKAARLTVGSARRAKTGSAARRPSARGANAGGGRAGGNHDQQRYAETALAINLSCHHHCHWGLLSEGYDSSRIYAVAG